MSRYFVMSSRTPGGDARAGTPTGVENSPPLDERAEVGDLLPDSPAGAFIATSADIPLQGDAHEHSSGRPLRVRAEASHLLTCGSFLLLSWHLRRSLHVPSSFRALPYISIPSQQSMFNSRTSIVLAFCLMATPCRIIAPFICYKLFC
jgi:hypothetical protein